MHEEPTQIEVSPKSLPGGLARVHPTSLPLPRNPKLDRANSPQSSDVRKRLATNDATGRNSRDLKTAGGVIHPSWLAVIELCRELGYGEIERLSIQDGVPVLAEIVKRKVRFMR
jgi:hypothetical protein